MPSRRGRRPRTSPPHPEKTPGKGFPPTNTLRLLHEAQNVDRRHPSHCHCKSLASPHATLMAVDTGQHLSPSHTRQPKGLPPPRTVAPASRLRAPQERSDTRRRTSPPDQPPATPMATSGTRSGTRAVWLEEEGPRAPALSQVRDNQQMAAHPYQPRPASSMRNQTNRSTTSAPAAADRDQAAPPSRNALAARPTQIGPGSAQIGARAAAAASPKQEAPSATSRATVVPLGAPPTPPHFLPAARIADHHIQRCPLDSPPPREGRPSGCAHPTLDFVGQARRRRQQPGRHGDGTLF